VSFNKWVLITLLLIPFILWIEPSSHVQAQQIDAAALFQQYCALCHGPEGKGDGIMAAQLNPKPRNFTKEPFKYGDTDEAIFNTIKTGGPNPTGMLVFGGTLTDDQIRALVQYVKSLRKQKQK